MAEPNEKKGKKKKSSLAMSKRFIGGFLMLAMFLGYVHAQVAAMLVSGAGVYLRILPCVWDIRMGDGQRKDWEHETKHSDEIRVLNQLGWKALFGWIWVHPLQRTLDFSVVTSPSDKESQFCESLLSYLWSSPLISGNSYPTIYSGFTEKMEWIKQCKLAWNELGSEEKALLGPLRESGAIPLSELVPLPEDNEKRKREARSGPLPAWEEESVRYTREELEEVLQQSVEHSGFRGFGVKVPKGTLDHYMSMNIRKAVEIPGTWKAVGEATRQGRITKFDARGLLPQEFWNVSFQTMKKWEGDYASKIAVFGDGGLLPARFSTFADAKDFWVQPDRIHNFVSIADERTTTVTQWPVGAEHEFPPAVVQHCREVQARYGGSPTGYVHTRRLPEFHKKLPDIEREMGLQDDILRGQSMLWLGSTAGGFHYDEEANVYLQLSGITYAWLVPQNWTDYLTGAIRHPWGSGGIPGREHLQWDPEMKDVPIFLIPLFPGDGITLQGRTYHRFMAQTHDRISLNWFFIPAWRKMEYTPADWYSIEAQKSLPRLAMRSLWARTLTRVYNETGLGIVYMGAKLEYL